MLLVTKLREEHLATRVDWMLNKEIYQKMPVPYPANIEDTLNWYNRLDDKRDIRIDFSVVTEGSNKIIGFLGLVNYNKLSKNAEFYIFLNPKLTGKGYGSLMMKWFINYSFGVWNLHKIYCYTIAKNKGANNFYKRLGFTHEGQLLKHMYFRDKYVDRNIFGLLRSQWISLPWQELIKSNTEYTINK